MIRSVFILLIILACYANSLQAQVSGRITDERFLPLQDVMILNKRTLQHTHSDEKGIFAEPNAKFGDTLQFSYLGYSTSRIAIGENGMLHPLEVHMEESSLMLEQVNISGPLYRNLQRIDLKMNPVQNSQELLRKVPGLTIAQHAGGGKAEQIFLRGFDIDHGTDLAIHVDQLLPVNMVSHAHGQGYADLHFIIPETVQNIDFEKGSYDAAKGNFATAGSVNFVLKDKIENNQLIFETGKFQTHRLAGLIKLFSDEKYQSYLAGELLSSDGYFQHPQDFRKFNVLLKFNYQINGHSGLKFTGSAFDSRWKASGQIPQRAVDAGLINRFGAIDPDEGGNTSRKNFMLQYTLSKNAQQAFKIIGYYSHYDFELYSNFTFFLNDSLNGDQIKQGEHRNVFGFESSYQDQLFSIGWKAAIGSRWDDIIENELSRTQNRKTVLQALSFGDVIERNYYGYIKLDWSNHKWDVQLQGRVDYFDATYKNRLPVKPETFLHSEFIMSPKLYCQYNVNDNLQFYAKTGFGFHSNDSRLLSKNSDDGLLTRSFNVDAGLQWKVGNHSLLHAGYWHIDMEDELLYVGDEAIVEPSGHTKRHGVEAGWRWQPLSWFHMDAETSFTIAKAIDEPESENLIPLAAKWSSSGGIGIRDLHNFSMFLRYRYLGDRPANEDNSIIAQGYQLIDGNINYSYLNMHFSLIAENIFNADWNEAQFATLSRLKNEAEAVEEIHFTAGSPFNFRLRVQIQF